MTRRTAWTGTARRDGKTLIRELLVGLFVALFLLSTIATLRAKAGKPEGAGHALALCLSNEDAGGAPPEHDCDSCRLGQGSLLLAPVRSGVALTLPTGQALPVEGVAPCKPAGCCRPWSRGPPDIA